MRILWIGGNHPRHFYYLNKIHEVFPVSGAIIENRVGGTNSKSPLPPKNLSIKDKNNFLRHFNNRRSKEEFYFGNQKFPKIPSITVSKNTLNGKKSIKLLKKISPDVVLIYGCHLLKTPLTDFLPKNTINLHGGLSPRYRGTATMFWPFYFLEPNHVGVTFHNIISEPDAGNIIHQSVPKLELGDSIHDVSCKAIITATKDMLKILKLLNNGIELKKFKQTSSGKNFLERDFKIEHLRLIYDVFDDKIVDSFLMKKIYTKKPKIINQFRD